MPGVGTAISTILGIGKAVVAPVIAGVGSTAGAITSTVGATAAAVPAIVGKAGAAVVGLGTSIPAAVGGVSGVAKGIAPAAELFGAGIGVYSAVKGVGQKEKALDIAAQNAANQKKALELQALQDERIYAPDLIYGAPQQPIESIIRVMQPLEEEKATLAKTHDQDQLMAYAPLILIGIAGIFLVRKIWK